MEMLTARWMFGYNDSWCKNIMYGESFRDESLWQCTRILDTSYQRVCFLSSHLHGVLGHNIHA